MQLFVVEKGRVKKQETEEKAKKAFPSAVKCLSLVLLPKITKMGHITNAQRYTISVMLKQGFSKKNIAETIGKDKSVVSREVKRNINPQSGLYTYSYACGQAGKRKRRLSQPRKFRGDMVRAVRDKIKEDWSPEQIVGHFSANGKPMVCVERIYQYIRLDKLNGGDLYKHCRHRLKKRRRHVGTTDKVQNRKSIDERPPEANGKRIGDLEMDLMVGRNGQDAVLTVVDRYTNYTWVRKLPSGKDAKGVADVMIRTMRPFKGIIKTITTDNGTEFAEHERISRSLGVQVYFAHPYHSWEKGCIEYTNKLYRQYLVKGCSFKEFSDKDLITVQEKINSRPRKKLGFVAPKDLFYLHLHGDKESCI